MRKVVVIGCGNVGSTFANLLYSKDICDVMLLNHNRIKAYSNVLDISDCNISSSSHNIFEGYYSDICEDDIVINCAGNSSLLRSRTRYGELDNSLRIARDITANLKSISFNGILINAMNPCDEITYAFNGLEIDKSKLIGTGTLLETLRLRRIFYDSYKATTSSYIVGNHGDNNWVVSDEVFEKFNVDTHAILNDVRSRVWKIYEGKGFTNFGICNALYYIVDSILNDKCEELCVSTLLANNHYIIPDNKIVSVPCILGYNGIKDVVVSSVIQHALYKCNL